MKKIILVFVLLVSVGVCFAQTITVDPTFNPGGFGPNNNVNACTVQPDGKILIGGIFTTYNNIASNNIARLNANGTIDETFNIGSGANNPEGTAAVLAIAVDTNGKIYIGGNFTTFNGLNRAYIARLNLDGSVDSTFVTSFAFDNTFPGNSIRTITIDADNKISIGGMFHAIGSNLQTVGINFLKFNPDGSLGEYIASDVNVHDVTIYEGKTLLGSGTGVFRRNVDGTNDITFNSEAGVSGSVYNVYVQNDAKVVVSGLFSEGGGLFATPIARLNPDGSLDDSFHRVSTDGINSGFYSFAPFINGQFLVGGDFLNYDGVDLGRIAVLNNDGTVNESYDFGSGFIDRVSTINVLDDNKILVGCKAALYNGVIASRFVRLTGMPLAVGGVEDKSHGIIVYRTDQYNHIKSKGASIKQILIHDLSGRILYANDNLDQKEYVISDPITNSQILICRIVLDGGQEELIKILN